MADPVSATLVAGSIFASAGGVAAGAATAGTFLGLSAGTYAAIAAGASGGLALMQGWEGYKSAKLEKFQLQSQARSAAISAVKDSSARTGAFLDTLASRNAAFGARNVALGLGTPVALGMNDLSNLNENQRLGALNAAVSAEDSRLSIAGAASRGRQSLYQGLMGAAQSASGYLNTKSSIGSAPKTTAQAAGNTKTGG